MPFPIVLSVFQVLKRVGVSSALFFQVLSASTAHILETLPNSLSQVTFEV